MTNERKDEDALSRELEAIVDRGPDRLVYDEEGNIVVDQTLDSEYRAKRRQSNSDPNLS